MAYLQAQYANVHIFVPTSIPTLLIRLNRSDLLSMHPSKRSPICCLEELRGRDETSTSVYTSIHFQVAIHSSGRRPQRVVIQFKVLFLSLYAVLERSNMSKKPGPPGANQSGPTRLRQIALVAKDIEKAKELLVRYRRIKAWCV